MSVFCFFVVVFFYYLIIEIPVLNTNSVEPDQLPHSAVSNLGLHCLQRSHLWDARLEWVKDLDPLN